MRFKKDVIAGPHASHLVLQYFVPTLQAVVEAVAVLLQACVPLSDDVSYEWDDLAVMVCLKTNDVCVDVDHHV